LWVVHEARADVVESHADSVCGQKDLGDHHATDCAYTRLALYSGSRIRGGNIQDMFLELIIRTRSSQNMSRRLRLPMNHTATGRAKLLTVV
jgi:hypothetical protein